MEKLVIDGKVAVLYSPGFGAGWSTWNTEEGEELIFDKDLAAATYEGNDDLAKEIAECKWPDAYKGGFPLAIRWVPIGTLVRINEYDGSESVEIYTDTSFFKA